MYEIIVALTRELSVTLLRHKHWPYLFAGLNTSEETVIKIAHEVGEHFHHLSEKPWSKLGGLRRTGFVFLKWFLWNWKYLFRLYKLALQCWKSNKLDGASCAQMHQTRSFFFCYWGEWQTSQCRPIITFIFSKNALLSIQRLFFPCLLFNPIK